MTGGNSKGNSEAQIRALVEDWAEAVRSKDAERVLAHYAADLVQFVTGPPLQCAGARTYDRKGWEEWFGSFRGPIGYEIRDLQVVAGEEVGFCCSLNRLSGRKADGQEIEMWLRSTMCLRKRNGAWAIAHEHESVSLYVQRQTLRAPGGEPTAASVAGGR